ncbi:MAG: YbbR-like domain-containing protein [Paludibacter sp.]|nr:YbbR-like domain-containing protein [Paludibacter sp.]
MANESVKRLLNYYVLKLKSFFWSKDVLSFLLFLALSTGFWFVNSLDKARETSFDIPVSYAGIPQNILITNEIPRTVNVKVRDEGLNLFSYSRNDITPITFDVSQVFYEKGAIVITPDQIRGRLSRLLLPTTNVLEINPDSILINYEKLSVASLPVEFCSKIELAHQYIISDQIQLFPPKITVFGPKRILDTLKVVKTELVQLKNVNDTTYLNCKLKPIDNVKFATSEVKVSIYVEMFTEKKLQIPVTVINCPENIMIKTFPAFVNVTCNVGMSHFSQVNEKDLTVLFDYNDIRKSDNSKLRLKFINRRPYITNVRISPVDVEYLIEMKPMVE